jgi:hypothetical protein
METLQQILESAIVEAGYTYTNTKAAYAWVDVEDHIINSLRTNGYVIKRAVPPCVGHGLESNHE